ncbi:hypothetical protein AB0F17_62930 [Nonomuraea sp. NPDC026600]
MKSAYSMSTTGASTGPIAAGSSGDRRTSCASGLWLVVVVGVAAGFAALV